MMADTVSEVYALLLNSIEAAKERDFDSLMTLSTSLQRLAAMIHHLGTKMNEDESPDGNKKIFYLGKRVVFCPGVYCIYKPILDMNYHKADAMNCTDTAILMTTRKFQSASLKSELNDATFAKF
jgi:hypothetical protein